jgi:hypothetical protein
MEMNPTTATINPSHRITTIAATTSSRLMTKG